MDGCRSLSRPACEFEERVPANRFPINDIAAVIHSKYVHEYRIFIENQGNVTTEQ